VKLKSNPKIQEYLKQNGMYYRVIYTDVIILLGENINTIERNDKPYESLVRRMTYKYTEGNIYVCS